MQPTFFSLPALRLSNFIFYCSLNNSRLRAPFILLVPSARTSTIHCSGFVASEKL